MTTGNPARIPATHLHVGFSFTGAPKIVELVPVLDNALDWIRYSDTNWVVWTNSTAVLWYSRLKPHLGPNELVLIIQISPVGAYGLLPKPVWDWLNRDKPMARIEPAHNIPWRQFKSG